MPISLSWLAWGAWLVISICAVAGQDGSIPAFVRHAGMRELSYSESIIGRQTAPASPIQPGTFSGCGDSCNAPSDVTATAAGSACQSGDTTCICDYLEDLSPVCLTCILAGANVTVAGYDTLCPSNGHSTTSDCDTQCGSASDQAANTALAGCPVASVNSPCVCEALSKMSELCLECLLVASNVTVSSYDESCGQTPTNYLTSSVSSTTTSAATSNTIPGISTPMIFPASGTSTSSGGTTSVVSPTTSAPPAGKSANAACQRYPRSMAGVSSAAIAAFLVWLA